MVSTLFCVKVCKSNIKALCVMYHRRYQTNAIHVLKPNKPSKSAKPKLYTKQIRHSTYFVMNPQAKMELIDEIKHQQQQIPSQYPHFVNSVQKYFPKSILMSEYFYLANKATMQLGFTDENTMGMAAICRDEITEGCMERIVHYWGKTFNCCSLAGFITMGKTGLGAATAHAPIDDNDGKRRFVFVAMPHIAISKDGVIGKCQREGIEQESHACGALDAIVSELKTQKLQIQLDMDDVEQSLVRQRILSNIPYGEKPTLDELTKTASDIILTDVDKLLSDNLDLNVYDYVVLTGVQIHGPDDIDWVFPNKAWHASDKYDGNKKEIDLGSL